MTNYKVIAQKPLGDWHVYMATSDLPKTWIFNIEEHHIWHNAITKQSWCMNHINNPHRGTWKLTKVVNKQWITYINYVRSVMGYPNL